jgi:hypothetical protein
MNRWHLLAIVTAIVAIDLGISYWNGDLIDNSKILGSSKIASFLGGFIVLFDWWIWRLPLLYPWFVPVPCIRGKWEIEGDVIETNPNQTVIRTGSVVIKQTYFSIWLCIDWDDNTQTRFLTKAAVAAKEEGFCAFTAVYEFDPKKPGKGSLTRRAGIFFHTSDRRPEVVTLHYSTTDNQVGSFRLSNRRKMSNFQCLMPH